MTDRESPIEKAVDLHDEPHAEAEIEKIRQEIAHYRRLLQSVSDQQVRQALLNLIAGLEEKLRRDG